MPPLGKRGYNEDEVDAFLDRVEAWLLNQRDPSLSAAAVQNIAFGKPPLGKRGYNEVEVDAFLARVETEVRRIGGAAAPRLLRARQAGRWQRRSSSSVS
jgi:DivIVA domain-containing protein